MSALRADSRPGVGPFCPIAHDRVIGPLANPSKTGGDEPTEGDDMTPRARNADRSARRLVATVGALVVATFAVVDLLLGQVHVNVWVDLLVEAAALAVASGTALWFTVIQPLRRDAAHERAITAAREHDLQERAESQQFEGRLHRALEMAETEATAYQVVKRSLDRGAPRLATQLLLADSSDAHLKEAVSTLDQASGCGVESPRGCPAIRRSQTLHFGSAEEIDACPHLIDRADGDRAAVCVPVSVAGRSIGVLHSTVPATAPPADGEVVRLEAIASQAGARIGLLRVMESTHLQAATDPLTGLLNRRSFENQVQERLHLGAPFAIAMADLDHFKQVNDTHGHDAGDRALRLFARILKTSLRGEDLVSRFGGEEFVVALPGLSIEDAARALTRVQEDLVLALTGGTVPPFTASFGLTHSDNADNLEELCRAADTALFRAKRGGRNRICLDVPDSNDALVPEARQA
jgi:diguanylate cyclase (GGDEF)-like protein